MLKRRSNTQNTSWFLDQLTFGRLDLDPPYQRKSVWTREYRQFFIDTVLNNYPCPPIFLNVETTSQGTSTYYVVDGKQRLTAIFDYIHDEFKTGKKSDPVFRDKYFSELSEELKTEFFEYSFTVENLTGASPEILNEAFDRLNRNTKQLTDQELRHAKFSGKFITLAETLAGDPFWREIDIATAAHVRRMKDIEFISEILILTINGVTGGNSDTIDSYYAKYDEEIPMEDQLRSNYENCKILIQSLHLFDVDTRFSNLADFYSLWAALLSFVKSNTEINIEETRKKLILFMDQVSLVNLGQKEPDSKFFSYSNAVRQGSNKAENRRIRTELLQECVVIDE